jgi:LysM repeat protein
MSPESAMMAQVEPQPVIAPIDPIAALPEPDPVASAAPMAAVITPAVPPSTTYFVPQPPTPVDITPTVMSTPEFEPEIAETPAATPASAPSITTTVTVKKGDVLERIARRHGTTVAQIMRLNNLTSTQLKIGQVLKVQGTGQQTAAATSEIPKSEAGASHYTVKQGDSPWLIANRNNIAVSELMRLNNLDEKSARRLKPGDRLRVR